VFAFFIIFIITNKKKLHIQIWHRSFSLPGVVVGVTEAEEDIIGCVDMLDGSIEVGEGWTLIDVGEAEALKDVAFIEMVADAFW